MGSFEGDSLELLDHESGNSGRAIFSAVRRSFANQLVVDHEQRVNLCKSINPKHNMFHSLGSSALDKMVECLPLGLLSQLARRPATPLDKQGWQESSPATVRARPTPLFPSLSDGHPHPSLHPCIRIEPVMNEILAGFFVVGRRSSSATPSQNKLLEQPSSSHPVQHPKGDNLCHLSRNPEIRSNFGIQVPPGPKNLQQLLVLGECRNDAGL